MTKDEALKLALEYIETNAHERRHVRWAIKEALAQPEQEPVARVIDNGTPEGATEWIPFTNRVEPLKTGDFLYTTPPQRPWVGLTDEEINACDPSEECWGLHKIARDIEAKLRELNAPQIDPNQWAFDNGLEST